ncbi:MAG: ATP-binding protein [Lachnospiraceae bacterium]|nr:ATP-binding protein [Lachnospiraceae bacterium]
MNEIVPLNNGLWVGTRIARIDSIPWYALIHPDPDRANYDNQVFFSQLLGSFHRKSTDGMTALELMLSSVEVSNQTYNAQVEMHMVIRQMGDDKDAVRQQLDSFENSLKNEFTDHFFDIRFFHTKEQIDAYQNHLRGIDCSTITSISKKEDEILSSLMMEGYLYETFIPTPAENVNTSGISNVLTQYPGSAVILQLIPTWYNQAELRAIEQVNNLLQRYAARMQQAYPMQPEDPAFRRMRELYQAYLEQKNEDLFYYNFLVCAAGHCAYDIAGKVADALEDPSKTGRSSYETIRLHAANLDLSAMFPVAPWQISNTLIYVERNAVFWGRAGRPEVFIRLKQLMTAHEAYAVFKLPIDDGKTIGIDSKKVLPNREKLSDSIISENNFKVGKIINSAVGGFGEGSHAGIPLNQFTKHGLIVGMPGSGKTNFSLGLLLRFWRDFQIPFLAIEPTKTEYRSLIDPIPRLQIFTPGKNDLSPFVINPFIPPRGVTTESYIPSLAAAFKAAFSMPDPLPDIFLGAINDCYIEYGWKKNSTLEDPDIELFGMYEFIRVFKKKIDHSSYQGETKANIESAGIVRLVSLIEQNSNIYDSIHTIPIEDLLSRPTVLELNAINNKEQKSLIMALILILFCVYTKNNVSGDGKLKNILLIDEAHVLLQQRGGAGDGADSQGSTVETLEDLIKEIRSYGTGIIIADQSPTSVGREILANTDVKMIFKLVEQENRDAVRTATNMSDLNYELLGRLGVGEALLHYGKLDSHLQIATYNVHDIAEIRDVLLDDEIRDRIRYWEDHQELLVAHRECKYNPYCKECCDQKLRTDADFVASRLVNDRLYQITSRDEFLQYLIRMGGDVKKIADRFSSISFTKRFLNCTKIKFLRKSMMKNDFGLTGEEYEDILRHEKFMEMPGHGNVPSHNPARGRTVCP